MFDSGRNEENPEFAQAMAKHYETAIHLESDLARYKDELKVLRTLNPEMIAYWINGDVRTVEDRTNDVEFFIGMES